MFLGERTQEFCTVYNMVRLADYLSCFTGAHEYLDYIENNLLYQAHSDPVAIGSIFAYNCTERDCFFHKSVI